MTGRNDRDRLCLIVNPRSAGGATGRKVNALRDAAARWFARWEVRETRRAGHATELATQAATEDFTLIAAVGGDGTANEVVNGLMNGDRARTKAAFTVVPAGTGSDLIKSLRIPKDLDDAMRTVATVAEDRATDVLLVECTDDAGAPITRACINVAGFGANGDVVARANQSSKRFGGTATFFGATLRTLRTYAKPLVAVRWIEGDGAERTWEGDLLGAFVGNGHYCGGGMWIGRGGSMHDGLAELTIVPPLGVGAVVRAIPRVYDGTLRDVDGVRFAQVRELEARVVRTTIPVMVDTDGEPPGILPLRIRVVPGALVVRGVWLRQGGN